MAIEDDDTTPNDWGVVVHHLFVVPSRVDVVDGCVGVAGVDVDNGRAVCGVAGAWIDFGGGDDVVQVEGASRHRAALGLAWEHG